jgi:radical SAM superfamily enzyme YgiQ (UPF0313 family)
MSGERIYNEIKHNLDTYKGVHFITFNDHTINANPKAFRNFINLIADLKDEKSGKKDNYSRFSWKASAVPVADMDREILNKIKRSGCIELEYGIESASGKVRKLMKKPPLDIKIAERVIRDTAQAGIPVRANFMFGFPGESKEDFKKTIEFLKRNRQYFSQVHPSETFCHVDPHTYMYEHPDEFGIRNFKETSLYWECSDKSNIYPERLRRHQEFCEVASSFGIPLSPGGHKIMLYKQHFLKEYSKYKESKII